MAPFFKTVKPAGVDEGLPTSEAGGSRFINTTSQQIRSKITIISHPGCIRGTTYILHITSRPHQEYTRSQSGHSQPWQGGPARFAMRL